MSFQKYLEKIKGDVRQAIKVEWLNPDETVNFEFTNSLYDISVDLNVNYQNGSRRSCTLTLNNDRNQFPVNFNNIWIGQKFKLWIGIYIDENTPYYLPQGVFYISNPNEVYQPNTKTLKINGVDKWAFLDGTLYGNLSGTYQTNIGVNLFDATRELLTQSRFPDIPFEDTTELTKLAEHFEITNGDTYYFIYDKEEKKYISNNHVDGSKGMTTLVAKHDMFLSFDYSCSSEYNRDYFYVYINDKKIDSMAGNSNPTKTYNGKINKGDQIKFIFSKSQYDDYSQGEDCGWFYNLSYIYINKNNFIDPTPPLLSPYYIDKKVNVPIWSESKGKYVDEEKNVLECPYTAIVERGGTYADILLEYATILCAHVYYDKNGRLVMEPMIDSADDLTDTNKELIWHYTVEEKVFLGLSQTYNFDKVYNDIIVLGNIVNGKQFKARVQNTNIMSDTSIQKIGLKTKKPIEDNQYYSDEQCEELAKYYAKVDTILQKSGSINSLPLYHIDVNKLVAISTPNNNMEKELFLITGYTINSLNTMTVNVTSVNELKSFEVV